MTKEEMDEIIILGKLYGVLIKVEFGVSLKSGETAFKYLAPNGKMYFYKGKSGGRPSFGTSDFIFTEDYAVKAYFEHSVINVELTEYKL